MARIRFFLALALLAVVSGCGHETSPRTIAEAETAFDNAGIPVSLEAADDDLPVSLESPDYEMPGPPALLPDQHPEQRARLNVVVLPDLAAARKYATELKKTEGFELLRSRNVVAVWDVDDIEPKSEAEIRNAMSQLD
jgi:hypothetical protein